MAGGTTVQTEEPKGSRETVERRVFLKVVASHVVLAACSQARTSNDAAPSVPSPTPAPSTVPAPPSTSAVPVVTTSTLPAAAVPGGLVRRVESPKSPIIIQYDPDVPEFWLQMIADTLPIGQSDLGDSGPMIVYSYSSADYFVPVYSRVASQSQDAVRARLPTFRSMGGVWGGTRIIWQYLPNHLTPSADQDSLPKPGGTAPSPPINLLHEYFHTVQAWLLKGQFALMPTWLQEGSADYWSYRAGLDRSLEAIVTPGWPHSISTFDQRRRTAINGVRRMSSSLSVFEEHPRTGVTSEAVNLGFIATEYLAKTFGVGKTMSDLYAAITPSADWKSAIASTFGLPFDQFYTDFESYRAAL